MGADNKFTPYYLYPECRFVMGVSLTDVEYNVLDCPRCHGRMELIACIEVIPF